MAGVSAGLSQVSFQNTREVDGFQVYQSQSLEHHSIRIGQQQNCSVCDARSKQYTGWRDVDSKHVFLYLEPQGKPSEDLLLLWLTGGPDGSGMI